MHILVESYTLFYNRLFNINSNINNESNEKESNYHHVYKCKYSFTSQRLAPNFKVINFPSFREE